MLEKVAAMALLGAAAPSSAPHVRDDVVVTARDPEQRRQEARAFVRAVSSPAVDGQMARWHRPICLAVLGLEPVLAARVSARIAAAAGAAGAALAKGGCRPNAFVVFSEDAQEQRAAMERRAPRLLAQLTTTERHQLRHRRAPVIWWHNSHAEGADGNQLAAMPSVALGMIGSSGPAIPGGDRTRFGDTYRSSTVSSGLRFAIEGSVVLVDVPRSTGRRLDSVSDYAAFVTLARVRADAPASGPATILSLFSSPSAPDALTAADAAYLKALYAVAPDRTARAQKRAMARAVARD